jgi:hypothetical protein
VKIVDTALRDELMCGRVHVTPRLLVCRCPVPT